MDSKAANRFTRIGDKVVLAARDVVADSRTERMGTHWLHDGEHCGSFWVVPYRGIVACPYCGEKFQAERGF